MQVEIQVHSIAAIVVAIGLVIWLLVWIREENCRLRKQNDVLFRKVGGNKKKPKTSEKPPEDDTSVQPYRDLME